VTTTTPARIREVAEAGWLWVLDQVQWADGPWIPASVPVDEAVEPDAGNDDEPPSNGYRDGLHDGIGGLALVLAEVRSTRRWTAEETELAGAIADRLRAQIPVVTDVSFFDGLAGMVGALVALDEPGADTAVRRMLDTGEPDGWPPGIGLSVRTYRPGARINDATLGTASALLAGVWAIRHDVPGAHALTERAAEILMAEAEPEAIGTNWRMVSQRFDLAGPTQMPNWSHGLAGIAAGLALAGTELDRKDLVEAARRGAEHLVSLGDTSGGGLTVPLAIPPPDPAKANPISYGWCHGPTGTSLLFLALNRAGVAEISGEAPTRWYARGRHSVRTSGLPQRLRPGFWDNDGRCCGTAGVGDAFLDAWTRAGDEDDLAFAVHLGKALVDRAVEADGRAYWRFIEHRKPEPLLPPGVGWMQGAAGIAAYLFHLARVLDVGPDAPAVPRIESWWAVDPRPSRSSGS
jgi:Lanthionine synthetase C-like protein